LNEAYLRLIDQQNRDWTDRNHFLSIASTAMRRVLLEHARARVADKRGGGAVRVTLFDVPSVLEESPEATVALDAALAEFAELDERNAKIVELRWFGGLTHEEIAGLMDVSVRTVERGWRVSRAWLRQRLEG
ncbi:MAG: ECF-type sigma factor, partial [Planctomycetota bacterium]